MVGSQHENHLQELAGIARQAATEPQQSHDTANANVLLEHVGDGHTGVQQLLATVVGDGGDESSGLTDETQLLGPGVVNGNLRGHRFRLGLDGAILDQALIDLLQHVRHVLEGFGDIDTSLSHGLVLADGSLKVGVGRGTGVSELDLGLEHAGAGTDSPGDNRLGDGAILDRFNDTVLLNTANLTKEQEDLALGLGLVAQQMVNEGGTRISVTANGNTLVNTVGVLRDDVVQLVGHATGLGDVSDGAFAVEFGGNNVVHHPTGVANLISARLNTTHGGRTDDGDTLLLGGDHDFTCSLWRLALDWLIGSGRTHPLGNTLGDNGNGLDLGAFHQLHGRGVDGAGRGEVDDGVNIGVLRHGLGNVLVDGEESLAGAPVPEKISGDHQAGVCNVHLADELATKSIDDTSNGRSGSLADEVEVEHALDGPGLHATALVRLNGGVVTTDLLDEASCLVVEEGVGERREDAAGRAETGDVIVGGLQAIGGAGQGGSGRHDELESW